MASTALKIPRIARSGPGRRAGRGGLLRSADGAGLDANDADIEAARDKVIQQTDLDASSSRTSAVALGYLDDEFASTLSPPEPGQEAPRRYPIINRGTYVRTKAIDKLVTVFLSAQPTQKKQIVSLGAGSDTRFFRLCLSQTSSSSGIEYHELDFETNVIRKRTAIRENESISREINNASRRNIRYNLHALDLRDLVAKSPPSIPNLDPNLPTLLISECCLCYLPPETTSSILLYFSMNIPCALALAIYEPIRPFDAFGKTMVSNLASRGIHLQTLKRYSTLEAQRQRLKLSGFTDGQGACDMLQLWESDDWTGTAERARVERLEWLDEIEEWQLLASHYCVAWGWRGEVFDEAFGLLHGGRTQREDSDGFLG